jgi:hypothetical protein
MMKFCSEIKMTHIKKKLSKRKMTGCAWLFSSFIYSSVG